MLGGEFLGAFSEGFGQKGEIFLGEGFEHRKPRNLRSQSRTASSRPVHL
jgi:hypothetical protein